MIAATFVFQAGLDFFLARHRRGRQIALSFSEHQTVKHLIESLGVPHVELGAILADGEPVGLAYQPRGGERIEVQAAFPAVPAAARFLLDVHLGRLAASLRMLGFDCLYRNDYTDAQIAALLAGEVRILLTRDRRLLMRKVVQAGYCLRALEPRAQLAEVTQRFQLERIARPFQRCLACNHPLERAEKNALLDRLEPKTKLYYNEFALCPACRRVYWKGSHFEHMQAVVSQILGGDPDG